MMLGRIDFKTGKLIPNRLAVNEDGAVKADRRLSNSLFLAFANPKPHNCDLFFAGRSTCRQTQKEYLMI